jgi:Family of unknown function (DUF5996)
MKNNMDLWPELPYDKFKSTRYLLHMGVQAIGKFKLKTPFEPHWCNVPLWLTPQGLTSGLIPYELGVFSIDLDMILHKVIVTTSWGLSNSFDIESMSVAEFTQQLFLILEQSNIQQKINLMPQEIENPIPFNQDTKPQNYDKALANAWWRITLNTYCVLKKYHSHFAGVSPPIGLMWGTFDLRDARYNGERVPTTGINAGYIRRNAMDEAQVEAGWYAGNDMYQKPAFFSFIYPQPKGIEQSKIKPAKAYWNATLMEFILDYDELRKSSHPETDLLEFFESSYKVGSELAGWDRKYILKGEPA